VPFGTCYVPLRPVYLSGAVSVTDTTISAEASADGANCKIKDSNSGFGSIKVSNHITTTGFANAENNGTFQVLAVSGGEIEISKDAGLVDEAAGESVTVAQGQRYYVLGDIAGGKTYTITKSRTPRELGAKEEFPAATYDFNQYTKNDGATDWRVVQPIIAQDKGGNAAYFGFWKPGDALLDMPTKFSRSDTAGLTDPADVIEFVLEDMGVPSDNIDTGVGSSFAAASTVFSGWGLTFNGAFWYKQPREKVLATLLNMCHATIVPTAKLELHVLSKTSQKTITKAEVVKAVIEPGEDGFSKERGEGTFRHRDISADTYHDSGYVAWQQDDQAQDKFIKTLVPAKAATDAISGEILEVPFVQDSQNVQRIGTLFYQRKYLKEAEIQCTLNGTCLALCPDDVITINHADYGGNYDVIIDQMTVRPDGSIDMSCIKLSEDLDDWGNLTPDAITINDDDTSKTWSPAIGGPLTSGDHARAIYEVWGRPHLVVGPHTNVGEYTDIQAAINALAESRHNGIYLLNGTYEPDAEIHLIDRPIEVIAESMAGVIIKNAPGLDLFVLHNLTQEFRFSNFTVESQTTEDNHDKFYVYGDTYPQNTATIRIENIVFNLDASSHTDYAVNINKVSGSLISFKDCFFNDGYIAVSAYSDIYAPLKIRDCRFSTMEKAALHSNSKVKLEILDNIFLDIKEIIIWLPGADGICLVTGNYGELRAGGFGRWFVQANGGSQGSNFSHNTFKQTGCTTNWSNFIGMYISGSGQKINFNTLQATTAAPFNGYAYAMYLNGLSDSQIISNNIRMDVSDPTQKHYGAYIAGDRNDFSNNIIDMVNSAESLDVAVGLSAGSDDNHGINNRLINFGTDIENLGTNNKINTIDGGEWT